MGAPRSYMPPIVDDWAHLDDDIKKYVDRLSLARSTTRSHEAGWRIWEQHCAELRVDPMLAHLDVFVELLLRRREDGHVYARGTHDTILAAIGAKYAAAGLVPAHKEPVNQGRWRDLMRASSREAGARKVAYPESAEQWKVRPLKRNDLLPMLTAAPASDPHVDACVATVLLAMDGGYSGRELGRLGVDEVVDGPEGIVVAGTAFLCDHVERVRGVPWDCTVCAIRAVLSSHSGEGPLLQRASRGDLVVSTSQRLRQLRDRPWGGTATDATASGWRSSRLRPADGLTPWQQAGLRRACVLLAGRRGEGGRWLRARVWTAVAWTCGFRMCGDLLRLDRDAVRLDPTGAGYGVHLAGTKDDPSGDKRVVRPLPWGDGAQSVAQMMAEYLCARDAVHGPGGSLLVSHVLNPLTPGQGIASGGEGVGGGTGIAKDDLQLLCAAAGLSGRDYTAYSTRKGFASQAHDDGWTVEQISQALRHQALATTLNSYLQSAAAKDVSTRLIHILGGLADEPL